MGIRPTIIARAFQLARSGECDQITRISDHLIREGYEGVHQHLNGTQIRKELRQTMKDGRQAGMEPRPRDRQMM